MKPSNLSLPPRWDLSNVYHSLDSSEFLQDINSLKGWITVLTESVHNLPAELTQSNLAALADQIGSVIQQMNDVSKLSRTLRAYINSFISTDSYNTQAMKILSEFEQVSVNIEKQFTYFTTWIGKSQGRLAELIPQNEILKAHEFFLRETAQQSKFLMSSDLEDLAIELELSGSNAWSKLQGTVTSQLTVEFELDGEVKTLPMPALINLHSHPDETVRKRAYEAEMQAWEGVKATLAAAMNGIKGTTITLNHRRGRQDALHSSLDAARIDRPTLEAMLSAMQASFPAFKRYFRAKAARLGKEKLAWWDVFAPSGNTSTVYSFSDAETFILDNFAGFSPDLAGFASRAFQHRWIDAEQRKGKRGGAFCMSVPGVSESRILCNFDGTLDQVSTIAHELGHAFHNECRFQAGKTILQSDTPMTLAETASIMCETIIIDAALTKTSDQSEKLAILETSLIGDAQVIVDIFSRYLFEKEVFERREKSELSPDDLCDIMQRSQMTTYGDALDEQFLHKFMWTWKPHYYYSHLSFYNFPYAFGLLFGLGLYSIYKQRGNSFVPEYKQLLASTGEGTAAELALRFGIDIHTQDFWDQSLGIIARRIDEYTKL